MGDRREPEPTPAEAVSVDECVNKKGNTEPRLDVMRVSTQPLRNEDRRCSQPWPDLK